MDSKCETWTYTIHIYISLSLSPFAKCTHIYLHPQLIYTPKFRITRNALPRVGPQIVLRIELTISHDHQSDHLPMTSLSFPGKEAKRLAGLLQEPLPKTAGSRILYRSAPYRTTTRATSRFSKAWQQGRVCRRTVVGIRRRVVVHCKYVATYWSELRSATSRAVRV